MDAIAFMLDSLLALQSMQAKKATPDAPSPLE
jgi:hypothetical protein